jgi:hypothetical protein
MKLNLKKIRFSLNNLKSARMNNIYNCSSINSPKKDNNKKSELDICIEPKSKIINSRKEGNKITQDKTETKISK